MPTYYQAQWILQEGVPASRLQPLLYIIGIIATEMGRGSVEK